MTLIICIKCKDGVVIGSDGRIVRLDEFRHEKKLFKVGKKLIIGAAGSSGVIKRIESKISNLVEDLQSEESINKIEATIAEIYRHHQEIYGRNYSSKEEFDRQFYGSLLAADDSNIYQFFFDGYPEPCGCFEAIGSASGYVRTLLETFYEENIDIERAKELVVYCILQAMKVSRDIGQPIQVGTIKKGTDAEILEEEEVEKIVQKINGREKVLHDVWNLLSKIPDFQRELEQLISEKLSASR